jgi:monovalent cation/hydrogen antiporter
MHGDDLVATALLVSVGALLVGAYRIRVPYPILLVAGSALLALVPGVPDITLNPDAILVLALPPLLYSAAFFTSLRDLRANLQPVGLLAFGLVLFTTLIVGVVAHELVGLDWNVAFVLGAIVSPTDPVAGTAIAGRLGAPKRYVTIVEGEAMLNDATGLIVYKYAVAAVATGSFSLSHAGGDFLLSAAGGIGIGIAIGWIVAQFRRRIEDPPTEIAISLLTPYIAYLPAEGFGVSAVLAAVTAGIYLGWNAPKLISPATRIQAYAFWETIVFALNCTLFVLVGLQLPGIVDAIAPNVPDGRLARDAALILATVILVRIAWVYPATYVPRVLSRRVREREPAPRPASVFLVAWTGMRGAVSLAAALAIPTSLDDGGSFPDRPLVIFLVYVVILGTLLLQGLTLPTLIRRLGIAGQSEAEAEDRARMLASEAAIVRIDELRTESWVRDDTATRMRGLYEFRLRRLEARLDEEDDGVLEQQSLSFQRLRREALEAERGELLRLRAAGEIDEGIMRRLERDLDLEDVRLEI